MSEKELTPEELQAQQRLDEFIARLERLMHEYPEVSFGIWNQPLSARALIMDGERCLASERVL